MEKVPRRSRLLTLLVGTLMALLMAAPPASARALGRVDDYRPAKHRLEMMKDGRPVSRSLAKNVRVVLQDADGRKKLADVNALVTGARILKLRDQDGNGRYDKVIVRELPSGSSDCSFDQSEEDDGDESWNCTVDHDGDDEDVDERCSYSSSEDGSSDADGGDTSSDVSWDCSYEERDEDEDEGEGMSWDCSYDASESASWDPSGGDSDGDTSFDCSWESPVPLTSPLWACAIVRNPLGWTCSSSHLEQSFGVTLTGSPVGFDAFLDFSRDYIDLDEEDTTSACDSNGGGSFSCSFDAEGEVGGCEVDLSFDRTRDTHSGDISGDMSYSCSYESDSNA